MKTFEDLQFKPHKVVSGVQAKMRFNNNYGISVIKIKGSYGYPNLWEVAVLYKNAITYDTYITDDVIGNQSDGEVTEIMKKIQNLL